MVSQAKIADNQSIVSPAPWRVSVMAVAALMLLLLGLWNLAGTAWWDEGWRLSVAHNWVERGFYGRLLDGQLAAGGLQAAFPVSGFSLRRCALHMGTCNEFTFHKPIVS